ncbi:Helicase [Neofusicoccum parvum]|nr:Helicase [Neofusicoccum parvum]
MARIQAASLSNRTIKRPRKRKAPGENPDGGEPPEAPVETTEATASASTTTSVPTKTHDGGKKPRRTKKSDAGSSNPKLRRNASSSFVESSVPWPDHFSKLQQTFRALNLVYTFCCTRKHVATTLDNIKSTVEGHIKRELLVDDVAQIRALVPTAINFAYVDEAMLQVNLMGSEDNMAGRRANEFRLADPDDRERDEENKEVLLFEFIDGDLKRQVQHKKTGEPTKVTQPLRKEDLKNPVYSQKQMLNLIEKRNAKFTSAVNAYLNDCAELEQDPVEKLKEEYIPYIPTPSESRAATPGPGSRTANLPSTIPSERKPIPEILEEIKKLEWYTSQIVPDGHRVFDPQEPIYGDLNFRLSQNLVNALFNTRNITQLYAHQAEAINNLYDGHNVIVSTSTSSGKSLIYQIPHKTSVEA